jgi:ATP-binding cassette subfamily B protein/subfamily B ATP-binding cassette protein MsbA
MKPEYWKYLPIVFPYLRKYKRYVAVSVALLIVGSAAAIAEPWPLALLINRVLGKQPLPGFFNGLFGQNTSALIAFAVIAGFVITATIQLVALSSSYVNTTIDQNVTLDFRSDLFRHCQSLSQAFHDHSRTGDFMYKINFEAYAAGEMSVALGPLAQSLLTVAGMFYVTYRLDPILAVIAMGVVPFVFSWSGYYGKRVEPRLLRARGLECESLGMVNQAMAMLPVISVFNRQRYEHRRFVAQGRQAVTCRIDVTVRQTLFSLAVGLTTATGTAIVLGIGAHQVLDHRLSPGGLLVIVGYVSAVYHPLETISQTLSGFQEHLLALRFSKSLFETPADIADRPGAIDIRGATEKLQGRIEFRQVSFTYPGRSMTLRDISFVAPTDSVTAIVGPTGAGKSTLISLLPRFIDPDEGSIMLDGFDLRDLTLESLRDQIAFVHQQTLLFDRSVIDNIRYGRMNATDAMVLAAAQAANADEFIQRLSGGYGTRLGENGALISGGERQRIGIARAFLKDAPILILDEPTSAIDARTEAGILNALHRLMCGRTTFIVAHRLSTIRDADQVIVLDEGRIVECGPPSELLKADGLFAQLHALQADLSGAGAIRPDDDGLDSLLALLRQSETDEGRPHVTA